MAENGVRMDEANNFLSARSVAPTNIVRMRQWRREFVQAGRRQQVENVLQTIAALHETHASPRRRIWALRKIRLRVRPMLDEFYSRLREQSLPLSRTAHATLERYLAIVERLAACYARVACQESERRKPSRKRMMQCLHASLELHQETLLIGTQVYIAPPSGFWTKVHRAYGMAERAGVAAIEIKGAPFTRGLQPQSVAAAYRRILAFSVAETQSLPQSQISSVFEAFANWVGPGNLDSKPSCQNPLQPLVWVDIDGDRAPEFMDPEHAARQMGVVTDGARFMSVTPIVAGLESLISAARAGDPAVDTSNPLRSVTVEHLLRRFGMLHERQTHREQGMDYVEVRSGIEEIQSSLSYIVTEEACSIPVKAITVQRECANAPRALFEAVEHHTSTPGAAPENGEDICMGDPPGRGGTTPNALSKPIHGATLWTEATPIWTLVDDSAQGLRVRCSAQRPSRIRVGQIIAYRCWDDNGAGTAWRLATVRWMRCQDANLFEFGAQKMDGNPYPAVVRRQTGKTNRKANPRQLGIDPALVVHRGNGGKSAVIVPPHLYNSGEIVDLDMGALSLRVELTAMGMGNANYAQFHYRPKKARLKDSSAAV